MLTTILCGIHLLLIMMLNCWRCVIKLNLWNLLGLFKIYEKFVKVESHPNHQTKMLLTSNFYSILYYNCEVWLSEGLNSRQKQQLMAASANALKILNNIRDLRTLFIQLHSHEKRALPMNFAKYRLAIQLFKIYNGDD